jgi:hypothetical protein
LVKLRKPAVHQPSRQAEARRFVDAELDANVRAMVDLHNAKCLREGRPEDMRTLIDDDQPYPSARSN